MTRTRRDIYNKVVVSTAICGACLMVPLGLLNPIIGNPWPAVLWFAAVCSIGEMLAVRMADESGVTLTPTAPAYWAAAVILGPVPAFIALSAANCLSITYTGLAYAIIHHIGIKYGDDTIALIAPTASDAPDNRFSAHTLAFVKDVAANWGHGGIRGALMVVLQMTGCLALNLGFCTMVYRATGGEYLIAGVSESHMLRSFILPFLALATSWCITEQAAYIIVMVNVYMTAPEDKLQSRILAAKLLILENVLPILKVHLPLTITGLLLTYLYSRIGPFSFILAAMPVLAVRDILKQWVDEKGAYIETITTLAGYMQHYHPYTRAHLRRVAELSERLAREMKRPASVVRHIGTAGLLHDIGKIAVSQVILDKPGALDDDEWEEVKEHPIKGAEIIGHLQYLEPIVDWIKYHHKWHNGAGYPPTRDGVEIPVEAAIIAVADAFDAMIDDREFTTNNECTVCGNDLGSQLELSICPECGTPRHRIYRKPRTVDEAINELRKGAGWQFNPEVVKAFLSMIERDGVRSDPQKLAFSLAGSSASNNA